MNRRHKIFTESLLNWFSCHGRKDLPWQKPKCAYRTWVSEIMLQQTQVITVIPYFLRFMERFPDVQSLATANEDDVFAYWAGLGFYRRARHLHQTAKIITNQFNQVFPQSLEQLIKLPGIGKSTAAAIASLAFDQPTAILDGNVKRVLSRYFLIDGDINQAKTEHLLWTTANQCMPKSQCAEYTQAIMDFGATWCKPKQPQCTSCPLQQECQAYRLNVVDNYPQKKAAKTLPTREQQFLVVRNQYHEIFAEKRPETGIWGGLWCFPQYDMEQCGTTMIQNQLGIAVHSPTAIMKLKHTFSHFHLIMHVIGLESEANRETEAKTKQWFSIEALKCLALPKPIQIIVETLATIHSGESE